MYFCAVPARNSAGIVTVELLCGIGEKRQFVRACHAGACGKEMKQQHEALADTGLGAALMRACETSTLARSARIDVGPCLGAGLTFCLAVVSEEEARCAARC